jgi:hypothetical protein
VSTSDAEACATGEPLIVTAINPPVDYTGSLAEEGFMTLFATGIVNPFGPTLTVLAAEGVARSRRESTIVRLVLNPFLQHFEEVGIAQPGEAWRLQSQLPAFFPLYAEESCPTLLMHPPLLGHEHALAVFAELLATFEDGVSVLEGVRRYPGDPMNRVQEQMNGLGAILEAGPTEQETNRRLTATQARELAENLLNPDNQHAETTAFLYAWKARLSSRGARGAARWRRAHSPSMTRAMVRDRRELMQTARLW